MDDASESWNGVGEKVVEVIDGRWVGDAFPDCDALYVTHAHLGERTASSDSPRVRLPAPEPIELKVH